MSLTKCPQCGWVHPPKQRKKQERPSNVTPIEILTDGKWLPYPSVKQAERETGIHRSKLFEYLRLGITAKVRVRLAKVGAR